MFKSLTLETYGIPHAGANIVRNLEFFTIFTIIGYILSRHLEAAR
jgi:hypothetical protein